jgi:GMP synthase (glutamine-hydrolysing)
MDTILVLDFGGQTAQLICRRIRDAGVYSTIVPGDQPLEGDLLRDVKGIVLSGSPHSVYEPSAPRPDSSLHGAGVPILGICYGLQRLVTDRGGRVAAGATREYGRSRIHIREHSPLFDGVEDGFVSWMSHSDVIERPAGMTALAVSENGHPAAMRDGAMTYGLQFHPEVSHCEFGTRILSNFAARVCGARREWNMDRFLEAVAGRVRQQVGAAPVVTLISGGVDSAVAAAIVHAAVGDQLTCIFVDNGLMRAEEPERVVSTFREHMSIDLRHVNASDRFLADLAEVTNPETKRIRIGETFIRVFEQQARGIGAVNYIVQGTTYPDVIESASTGTDATAKIKTHHNVGGLPKDMELSLIEPLRNLFKDEVRRVGSELGLPDEMVYRQPYPGPGLAIRVIGEVTPHKLDILRRADWIVMDEIKGAAMYYDLWQSFAVLTDTRTVGVQGDGRTYGFCVALRCVTAEDAMTADWARLPYDLLATISRRIVNEVPEVNRVVYDITSKPPGTIEWE